MSLYIKFPSSHLNTSFTALSQFLLGAVETILGDLATQVLLEIPRVSIPLVDLILPNLIDETETLGGQSIRPLPSAHQHPGNIVRLQTFPGDPILTVHALHSVRLKCFRVAHFLKYIQVVRLLQFLPIAFGFFLVESGFELVNDGRARVAFHAVRYKIRVLFFLREVWG